MRPDLFLSCLAVSGLAQNHNPSAFPLEVRSSVAPRPFPAAGKVNLVYEPHLTNSNRGGRSITRTRVDMLGGSGGTAMADYGAKGLAPHLPQPGDTSKQPDVGQLAGGKRAVALIWLTRAPAMPTPDRIRRRVTATIEGVTGDHVVERCEVSVASERPVVLGPPLSGGDWLAAHGPSDSSPERRRAFVVADGEVHSARRFALDWVRFLRTHPTQLRFRSRSTRSWGTTFG